MTPANESSSLDIKEHIPLANFTTLRLGGNARYFIECGAIPDVYAALDFCRRNRIRWHILGGGSNTIFTDEGFEGAVIRIGLRGVQFLRNGDHVRMVVRAGESWDDFVRMCIHSNLAGIECLSGIPGLVGATPIQNVGAYGQEVSQTIESVRTIDVASLEEKLFPANECQFEYRASRFNQEDSGRYVIVEVIFRLKDRAPASILYPELKKFIGESVDIDSLSPGKEQLEAVRSAVLSLRRRKSMVIDPDDPNSQSAGSFFKNPVLTTDEFAAFRRRCVELGMDSFPTFPAGKNVKVPAAWLVEHAGFARGFKRGGVGISSNHSLALVNFSGTTSELLGLAEDIQGGVFSTFGIRLDREPVVVG